MNAKKTKTNYYKQVCNSCDSLHLYFENSTRVPAQSAVPGLKKP